ncbi:phenmedipham hydrolase [Verticillium dahliae]|uniref:Carboxylic ester hydrolase n=1 Tax=Verticillium dahliae TaxID=27337 RepID=A0AA45AKB1_VERDA|nr:phenmedipham hydrolase [Verticillium dahliae]KAH6708016.1 phenmedipham hydrolase [Verticillium dahliae]PNH30609.1 hypothetical protein BJF96_g6238 [Verticillium dahliae]
MSQPTVRLRQGTYRGKTLNEEPNHAHLPQTIEAFLGLPYAKIPGRFRDADAPPCSEATFDAVKYGLVCPSILSEMDLAEGWAVEEDCLSANVFRPAGLNEGDAVPVVVYVHGGTFNMGKGGDRDMASFVAYARGPIVAVSFNYRVGPLGFLPSSAMEEEGLLNLGLRDQRVLLRWVRDNVAAFGGDGEKVTLMGVSAGAHSIGHHLLTPDPDSGPSASAPSYRAILESGAATARSVLSAQHARHEDQFNDYLAHLQYPPSLSSQEIVLRLRVEPLSRLLAAAAKVWLPYAPSLRWPFQPVIDGPSGIIPSRPSQLWAEGRGSRAPLLTGFNSHEGATFVPDTLATDADFRAFFHTLLPGLSAADLDALSALYPAEPQAAYGLAPGYRGAHFPRAAAAYAHQAYVAPVLWTACCAAAAGADVWVYEFAARGPVFGGAAHGEEGGVVARDRLVVAPFEGLGRVAEAMHARFSRFVQTGQPDGRPGGGAHAAASGHDAGDGPGGGSGSGSGSGSGPGPAAAGDDVSWSRFMPPFDGDRQASAVKDFDLAVGRILVFGGGNDERAGGANPGTVARMRPLTAREIRQCRFWWQRAHLGQGTGEARAAAGRLSDAIETPST